jgi:hypothetical protein
MTRLQVEILTEFAKAQAKSGYKRPNNLSDIERCPSDDDDIYQEDSSCPVDTFLRKNKGLR